MTFDKLHEEQGIALADFLVEFSAAPFELLDGEKLVWMPGVAQHSEIIDALKDFIRDFLKKHPIGTVHAESAFILEHNRSWVKGSRIPDVMVYAGTRLADYKAANPVWKDIPYVLVPDIAIEVVSKNDAYSAVDRKVDLYLADGVKEVWVIDPHTEKALVHTQEKLKRFTKEQSLRSEILIDFELELGKFLDCI
jgi:Uma2 family endonuclease